VKHTIALVLAGGAALGLLAQSAAPRFDTWRTIGPGGGGAQFTPTVSPHDTSRVLVACDMTGSYITNDSGKTWRMFNLRGVTRWFVFDPSDAQVIYAYGVGLWRSVDSGRSWNLVYPDPAAISGVIMPDDHAGVVLQVGGSPVPAMTALAVDPADSRRLYAVIQGVFHESGDWGATWRPSHNPTGGGRRIYVDPRSPTGDRTLYVVGASNVTVREGGQWKSQPGPANVTSFLDVSAGFLRNGGLPVIYGLTAAKLYVSVDGGAEWSEAAGLGEGARLRAVATSLSHPQVAYLSYGGLRDGGATYIGVAKTEDHGRSWNLAWKEAATSAPNILDAWIGERFGPGWGSNPLSLGVAPSDPAIAYATDYGRTMRTTDGGKTWHAAYSRRDQGGGWTSTGLDVTTVYGVHWDPFDAKRMFITYTDIGLFRSEDGGASWLSSTAGVPRRWWNTTYWVEFDPDVRGRMWAVMSRNHDLPRPKMWRTTQPSTYEGGVCVSDDGGLTWRQSSDGMPQTAATHILMDRRSIPDARVLYVAAFGRGVYKSTDGGRHWALFNNGIEGKEPFAWRLTQDDEGTLYLVVARRSDNGSFGDSSDGALYRSTDGAENWERLPLPEGVNGPNGLTVDPLDRNRLYLAAWGRRTASGARDGGVFLSTDGGRNWRNVLAGDQHVYDVTVDTRGESPTLYAGGFESSAWRSEDRGASWQRIRGYNFKWGHRVIPDPADPDQIYVATYGGSVWHGPAKGDPEAQEDVLAPALRLWRTGVISPPAASAKKQD
jgi:photosystem II stability/assembly factor-like uncharacterized protein